MHLTTRSQFPLRKWVVSIAAASCDRLVAEAVLGGVCGQLDATEHAELAQEHGISGFPALRFFPAGLPVRPSETYDGELHAADLIEFLNEVRVWDCVHAALPDFPHLLQSTEVRYTPSLGRDTVGARRKGGGDRRDRSEVFGVQAYRTGAAPQRCACARLNVVLASQVSSCAATEALAASKTLPRDRQEDARTYTDLMRGAIGAQDAVAFLHKERRRVQDKLSRTEGTPRPPTTVLWLCVCSSAPPVVCGQAVACMRSTGSG